MPLSPVIADMADLPLNRPPSVQSIASNSSVASGVSLTRRPRIRGRSKTLTGDSVRPDFVPNTIPTSELPYLDVTLVQDPSAGPSSMETLTLLPHRSPRLPQRTGTSDGTSTSSLPQKPDVDRVAIGKYPVEPVATDVKLSKAARQASNLPEIATRPEPLSAFGRTPSLDRIHNSNARDSMMTETSQSTDLSRVSSSLYPPSTSTASGTESPPSPRSMALQEEHYDVSAYDPEVDEVEEYDGDDVSYRLRLLVKNNYFLPPAHSKPSPSDFASAALNAPKRPSRATTPTFLDKILFGKSKSKPPTPTGNGPSDPLAPVLRTTSDSTMISGYNRPPLPRSSSQIPRHSPQPGNGPPVSGRVVVVREKMNDLIVAAKQAEQEMKARAVRREQEQQNENQQVFDNIIDPTDAVDLPPPSSTYPFAVQASALHGLGVQDSVGAAQLADRLPPPTSPGPSSYDADDDWRKALLHQAVHHSLDNTPDMSSFSMMLGASSTPLASPRVSGLSSSGPSRGPSPSTKRLLEQRIVVQPIIEDDSPQQPVSRRKSTQSKESTKRRKNANLTIPVTPNTSLHPYSNDSARSSCLPLRVETPTGPQFPLTPPPRRIVNPLYSLSQTDLSRSDRQETPAGGSEGNPGKAIRKAVSSPMLSEQYESGIRRGMMITPPPLPGLSVYGRSSSNDISREYLPNTATASIVSLASLVSSGSYYSGDQTGDEDEPRSSLALSAPSGRPSLSEYSQASQASPTTSVFQEMLNRAGYRSGTSSFNVPTARSSLDQQHVRTPRDSPAPRYSAMSPPPRMSSSLAHFALSPPPRSSSFHYRAIPTHMAFSTTTTEPSQPGTPSSSEPIAPLLAPEPTTPPFPITERRGITASPAPLSIPTTNIPVAIHSAPGPSSPTSFFDTIQTQPNAMDDLESSSDESDSDREDEHEEDTHRRNSAQLYIDPRTRAISNISANTTTPSRPAIMRLGNHSTPYIGRGTEGRRPSLPFGVKDPKKPIGYTPERAPFFTDRKSDNGHGGPPVSTFDFYKYIQEHPAAPTVGESSTLSSAGASAAAKRRPATAGDQKRSHVAAWQNNQKAQDSLRRLDGMLIQHMETEKDTIKRIATTLHSNSKPTRNMDN